MCQTYCVRTWPKYTVERYPKKYIVKSTHTYEYEYHISAVMTILIPSTGSATTIFLILSSPYDCIKITSTQGRLSHRDFCCENRSDECVRQCNPPTDYVRWWHWCTTCPEKTWEFPENPGFFYPFLWGGTLSECTRKSRWSRVGASKIIFDFYPVICLVRWIMDRFGKVEREVVKKLDYQW